MKKIKETLLERDFGAYLYDLREKSEYTVEELVEKINMQNITTKTIKKWEHDLEFPNLDIMYKLSEIYEVPIENLMQIKTQTLEEGVKGINKGMIRFIGYLLGIPIYGAVIFSYVFLIVGGIGSVLFFAARISGKL